MKKIWKTFLEEMKPTWFDLVTVVVAAIVAVVVAVIYSNARCMCW